jgi:hypothetical protein
MTWVYGGKGKAYCVIQIPSKGDMMQYSYTPYEIDLNGKTGRILGLPYSMGWAATGVIREGNQIFFALATSNAGNGIYSYDMNSGKCNQSPVVKTEFPVYKVVKLGK